MILSGQFRLCVAGETWDSIALAEYRDEKYACELLNANPDLSRVTIFEGGELLALPVVEVSSAEFYNENDPDEDEGNFMPQNAPWKE